MQIAILHHPTTTLEIIIVPEDIGNIEDFLEETYGLVDINYMAADEIPVKFIIFVARKPRNLQFLGGIATCPFLFN